MVGAKAASRQAGTDSDDAEDEHELAAVAVAQRAEPQDGRREAERVADGHEVEGRLRRVEGQPDRGQGDVGDGQVEVGDRRDEDQREEDEAALLGDLEAMAAGVVGAGDAGCAAVLVSASGRPSIHPLLAVSRPGRGGQGSGIGPG